MVTHCGETRAPPVVRPRGLSTDLSRCYDILLESIDRLRSEYSEPRGLVRAQESPKPQLFKTARLVPSPLSSGTATNAKRTRREWARRRTTIITCCCGHEAEYFENTRLSSTTPNERTAFERCRTLRCEIVRP